MDSDRVVTQYFLHLETFLQRRAAADKLHQDLLERAVSAKSEATHVDNSEASTQLRVSWCLHGASDRLLHRLGVEPPTLPPSARPLITLNQCAAIDAAAAQLTQAVMVGQAEHAMGDVAALRGAEQLQYEKLKRLGDETSSLRELIGYTRAYIQGLQTAAGTVGTAFFNFLTEDGVSCDELVQTGERLIAIHV